MDKKIFENIFLVKYLIKIKKKHKIRILTIKKNKKTQFVFNIIILSFENY